MLRFRIREIITPILILLTIISASARADKTATVNEPPGMWSDLARKFGKLVANICPAFAPGAPITTPDFIKEIARPLPATVVKSEGELRQYLECYSKNDKTFERISKEFLPLIDSAARAFGLPKAMLACLILRESNFDPTAKSPTGAFGLGQHVFNTNDLLTKIIVLQSPAKIEKFTDIATSNAADNSKFNKTTIGQAYDDISYAKTKMQSNAIQMRWDDYFNDLNSRGIYKAARDKQNGAFAIPRVVSDSTLRDPRVAIGATALYLHFVLTHLQNTLDPTRQITNSTETPIDADTLLAGAGAYNMGHGAAAWVLGSLKSRKSKDWVEALMKSNEETAGYIISIRNCISPSTAKGAESWAPPSASPAYSCKVGDRPRIALGPATKLPDEYANVKKHAGDVMAKKPKSAYEEKHADAAPIHVPGYKKLKKKKANSGKTWKHA